VRLKTAPYSEFQLVRKSLTTYNYGLPLLRKGIIAGKNPNNRTLILDSPAYQGNSGGPVWLMENPSAFDKSFWIVGIVAQFVPFEEIMENRTYRYGYVQISNSGYSIVVPSDYILETIW
jgi:hypothetical protein